MSRRLIIPSFLPSVPGQALTNAESHPLLRGFEVALRSGARPRVKSAQTIAAYRAGVLHHLRYLEAKGMPDPTQTTREHVQEWLLSTRGYAARSARLYLAAVKVFYAWLQEEGERVDVPTVRLSVPLPQDELPQPYSAEDLRRIFKSQDPKTVIGARNTALFYVLLDTALRRQECAGIMLADVDLRQGTIRVLGKGARERKVRVGAATLRAIDQYLRRRERQYPGLPWLWHAAGRHDAPLTAEGCSQIHRELAKALGIHIHPHRWRHTAIQAWLDAGLSREDARMLSGHSSEIVFSRYSRYTDGERALRAHERVSAVDRLRQGFR